MKTITITQEEIYQATNLTYTGIERNILEKINTGIKLLKINSYIDCIKR
jgi:hypothetical protein